MLTQPYRWRLSAGFVAHLWKAATQQHHRALGPTIARLVPAEAIVFDVGAHAGQYTKLFARAAPQGRVYAFEPGSYARTLLRVAIWVRRLRNVTIVPIALGDAEGVAVLNIPVKRSGSFGFGLSHLGAPADRWTEIEQELVAQTTLDAAVAALGLDRLDFVKADIEGWEMRLLRGASDSLARLRPRLLLELSAEHLRRAGDHAEDAFDWLAARAYRPFTMDAGHRLNALAAPRDGDIWFLPADDPAIAGLC